MSNVAKWLGAILLVLLFHEPADAKRVPCNSVQASAEVDVEPNMTVAVSGDDGAQTCLFHVSAGPTGPLGAVRRSMMELQQLAQAQEFSALAARVEDNFVLAVVEALLEPLQARQLDGSDVEGWRELIVSKEKAISDCTFLALAENRPFSPIDDVLSCGVDGESFRLEVRMASATLSLYLPLA
jgi:hypothetical protein